MGQLNKTRARRKLVLSPWKRCQMADPGEQITPEEEPLVNDESVLEDSGGLRRSSEDVDTPITVYRGLSHLLSPLMTVIDSNRPSSETDFQSRGCSMDTTTLQIFNSLMQDPQVRADILDNPSIEFCRICREASSREDFLSPCHCKGTLGNVHLTCLQRWLAESDTSYCELCGFQYKTVRIPRYNLATALSMWCIQHSSRDLGFDALAFCAFTPVAALGTYLGMLASDSLDMYEDTGPVYARTLTLGVVSLMAAIDFAYVGWVLIRLQHHFHQWYSWWRRNCVVNIVFPEEKNDDDTTTKTLTTNK